MASRLFSIEVVGDGAPGARRQAPTIHCAECDARAHFLTANPKRPPPEAVEQHFRKIGWRVGGGPRADLCPDCMKRKSHHLKVVETLPDLVAVDTAPATEAPRQMGFADRRLIMIKLEEVYLDERTGYVQPWTDQKVATDLNVPRAWVTELREQNFGPIGSNPEFARLVAEAQTSLADGEGIVAEYSRLVTTLQTSAETVGGAIRDAHSKLAEVQQALGMLVPLRDDLSKRLGEIKLVAKSFERAIDPSSKAKR